MSAVVASTRWGPMLVPPYDAYVGQALIRLGAYCPAELIAWEPYIPPDGVVVDAGANLGAHTLPLALRVAAGGFVIAVEPQTQLYRMICGTLALNPLPNVHVKHAALGRERSLVRIPRIDYTAPGNFGGLELSRSIDGVDGDDVQCLPLDAFNLERLDFIKIDVEGWELDVLHGGAQTISRCRPVMSVEADREQNVPATLGWLRLNGYRAWWHRPALGPLWPRTVSVNLLCLPRDREDLPVPTGDDVEVAIE